MITSEVAVAYTQCKLKAYLLLFTDKKGTTHEYISILEEEARKNKAEYFRKIKMDGEGTGFNYPFRFMGGYKPVYFLIK